MKRHRPDFFLLAAIAGGFCYPPLVYFGRQKFPAAVFVAFGLSLIALRLCGLRKNPDFKLWAAIFAVTSVLLIVTSLATPAYAPQIYPVAVSLSVAVIFGLSLFFPPPLVERIARLTEPDLSPAGIRYTRKVTIVWTVFLLLNAALSAGFALWGSIGQWALWTGLLSYVAMGILFAGEYAVRKVVRR